MWWFLGGLVVGFLIGFLIAIIIEVNSCNTIYYYTDDRKYTNNIKKNGSIKISEGGKGLEITRI